MNTLRRVWLGALVSILAFGGFSVSNTHAAVGGPIPPVCDTELIANGSFEVPALVNPQGWDVVPSGQNGIGWLAEWVDATPLPGKPVIANIELQNGRPAQDGLQYTELDSDYDGTPNPLPGDEASVKVYQDVVTTPGSTYKVSFFTSPIPGFDSANNITKFYFGDSVTPVLVDTIAEDGSGNATTAWTKHEYTLTATTAVTRISFADGGVADSFGPFLDMVSAKEVCAGGGGGGALTYVISGKVWNDANNDGVLDGSESGLDSWKVFIDTDDDGDIDSGETVVPTNVSGEYSLNALTPGTYTIREYVESGWDQTYPTAAQQFKHVVTIVAANITDKNFGNFKPVGGGGGGSGGASGGAGVVLIPTTATPTPIPTVAGDATTVSPTPPVSPSPQVLGSTTELPRTGASGVPIVALSLLATITGLLTITRFSKE